MIQWMHSIELIRGIKDGFSVIAAAAMLGLTLFMAVKSSQQSSSTIDELNNLCDMKDRYQSQLQSDINITSVTDPQRIKL